MQSHHSDEELVRRAADGDDDAVDRLLARYRPLVRRQARRYFVPGGGPDDVVQEGMIGLYKAVRRFDPQRGPVFAAFADLCVRRQILTAIASAQRQGNAPLNTSTPLVGRTADGDGRDVVIVRGQPSSDPAEWALSNEAHQSLVRFVATRLTTMERRVLTRFLDGQTYDTIGDALGCSHKAVDNALQRARRKIASAYLPTSRAA